MSKFDNNFHFNLKKKKLSITKQRNAISRILLSKVSNYLKQLLLGVINERENEKMKSKR